MSTLKELIREYSSIIVEANEINTNTNLTNDLGYDSIGFIQLISDIEDEYNIIFDLDDLDISSLARFEELERVIMSKIENGGE